MKNKFHTMLNERVKLSYLPGKDEYQVEIIPTPSSLDRKGAIIKIPSHILDELHNRAWARFSGAHLDGTERRSWRPRREAWEGEDDPHMDKPNTED